MISSKATYVINAPIVYYKTDFYRGIDIYFVFFLLKLFLRFSSFILFKFIIFVNSWSYILGGYTNINKYDKTIARLDDISYLWTKVGELNQGRRGHNAIVVQGEILVVGGYTGSLKTERCIETDGQIRCSAQEPELTKYAYYPELFAVPDNYCI